MPIYRVPVVVRASGGGGVGDSTAVQHGEQSTSGQQQRPTTIQVFSDHVLSIRQPSMKTSEDIRLMDTAERLEIHSKHIPCHQVWCVG